jgi:hypothetical protein
MIATSSFHDIDRKTRHSSTLITRTRNGIWARISTTPLAREIGALDEVKWLSTRLRPLSADVTSTCISQRAGITVLRARRTLGDAVGARGSFPDI